MYKMGSLKTISGTLLAVFLLAQTSIGLSTAEQATPTDRTPGDLGCSLITVGALYDHSVFGECTQSRPWWSSYRSCAQTWINSTPWPVGDGFEDPSSVLAWHPFMQLQVEDVAVRVTLYFGSRPMEALPLDPAYDGAFPVTFTFTKAITTLEVEAVESTSGESVTFDGEHLKGYGDGRYWDLDRIFPTASGCWNFTIVSTTEDGRELRFPFTFITVE